MMMMSTLYKTNMLSWIIIVLAHWNNSLRVDMSLHSDTLSWFRANQRMLFLLNAASLVEKQCIQILYSLISPDRASNSWSSALEASTLTITPLMQLKKYIWKWLDAYIVPEYPNWIMNSSRHHYSTFWMSTHFDYEQDELWANAHLWYPRSSANRK